MTCRRLRIVFSAAFGMLCLLLIVSWIRSFGETNRAFFVGDVGWRSEENYLTLWHPFDLIDDRTDEERYAFISTYMHTVSEPIRLEPNVDLLGIHFFFFRGLGPAWILCVPYWLAVLMTGGLAVATWIKCSYRFSLRTLLVGMTVAAAVLGTAVYMTKQ